MGLLSKQAILGAADRRHEDVPVPEWGGAVRVASMSGTQRDEWEAEAYALREGGAQAQLRNSRARLVARCAVDDKFDPLFTAADLDALGKKSAAALNRLYEVAIKVNGLGSDDVKVAEKN